MFASLPVIRLSSASTSQPSASNRSHKCDPRNPAPPVTTALIPPPCCSKNRKFSLSRGTLANPILRFALVYSRELSRIYAKFHFAAYNLPIQMILATILPNTTARKSRLILSVAGSLLFLLLLAFLNLGRWLDKEDPPQKAAAIAVLSGRMPSRALEAGRLYHQGYAPQIWLSYSV